MKQTNEQRIAKLEQEVNNLKSIIIQLQSKLIQQDTTLASSTTNTSKQTKSINSMPKLSSFDDDFETGKVDLSKYTNRDVRTMTEDEKLTLINRLKVLSPLMRELIVRYIQEEKAGNID